MTLEIIYAERQPRVGATVAFNAIAIALTAFDTVFSADTERRSRIDQALCLVINDHVSVKELSFISPYDERDIVEAIHGATFELQHNLASTDPQLVMAVLRVIGHERSKQRTRAYGVRTTAAQEHCLAESAR